jgi:hypothetical protein
MQHPHLIIIQSITVACKMLATAITDYILRFSNSSMITCGLLATGDLPFLNKPQTRLKTVAETGFQARMAQYLASNKERSKKISEKVENIEILRHPLSDFTLTVSNRPTDC